jgi:hypothetical protein
MERNYKIEMIKMMIIIYMRIKVKNNKIIINVKEYYKNKSLK